MNLFAELENWLQDNHTKPFNASPIQGGSICEAYRLDCADGTSYFVKHKADAPARLFAAEAAGLKAIAATNTVATPEVHYFSDSFLLLAYLPASTPDVHYWETLAQQLASMHRIAQSCFGFSMDNFCGSSAQPNPYCNDGHEFFAHHRLLYQGRLAFDQGLLENRDLRYIERLCSRLTELIPEQPPCLVQGDLWSGNHHPGHRGQPFLIDPACYWGWAETDIAMSKLFGGFPDSFYQRYLQHNPFQPGWQERMGIYNLYHLLNHLNLFGRSYYDQILSILKRYQ